MKVIILGCGIGGLATYHALTKHLPSPSTVDIYEAYPSSTSSKDAVGAGLVLGPNGQRTIASILPSAMPHIRERGFGFSTFTFRNEHGTTISRLPFGSQERYGYSQMVVSRATVHDSLILEGDMNAKLHWNMRVKRVWETDEAAHVEFEDGTVESCDILVGADGAKSKSREAVFGEEFAPKYDGFTGLSGIIHLSSISSAFQQALKDESSAFMTVSRMGYFGLSLCTPSSSPEPTLLWFTSLEITPPPPRDTPRSELVHLLLQRFGDWVSPYDTADAKLFREVLSASSSGTNAQNWITLPRYYTPVLPHWTSLHGLSTIGSENGAKGQGRIILLGDAAHCMPPDGGQGVSQAVEDALTLALVLKHYISMSATELEAISKAAKSYEDVRMGRVNKILVESKQRQNRKKEVSALQQTIKEWFIWAMSWIPEGYIHDETYGYDVEFHVAKHLGMSLDQL